MPLLASAFVRQCSPVVGGVGCLGVCGGMLGWVGVGGISATRQLKQGYTIVPTACECVDYASANVNTSNMCLLNESARYKGRRARSIEGDSCDYTELCSIVEAVTETKLLAARQ